MAPWLGSACAQTGSGALRGVEAPGGIPFDAEVEPPQTRWLEQFKS
jgi:hypothetical protein